MYGRIQARTAVRNLTFSALGSLLASSVAAHQSAAMLPVPSYTGPEAWVDPHMGNDVTAIINDRARPFRTIGAASSALQAAGVTPEYPGFVFCNPGVYGPASVGGNDEPLPIAMRDNINLKGAGPRRSIIRGTQQVTPGGSLQPFYPFTNNGADTRPFREVLVDATKSGISLGLRDTTYEESFDGFTLQGGHVQFYYETEFVSGRMRISNCVFDMLDYANAHELAVHEPHGLPSAPPSTRIKGPDFGILIVHRYDSELSASPFGEEIPAGFGAVSTVNTYQAGYRDVFLNAFHNTFIQGWLGQDSTGAVVTFAQCVSDAVAIADVANTLRNDSLYAEPWIIKDPNPTYRGVGSLNLQNNLIRRTADPFQGAQHGPGWALLGVDVTDVTTLAGATSNAFDPARTNGTSATVGPYQSQLLAAPPTTALSPVPGTPAPSADPAFVGEFLQTSLAVPIHRARDWRLLPGSPLEARGVLPTPSSATQPFATLEAANRAVYYRVDTNIKVWPFLFDGEGYGNLRGAGGADIGCDEVGELILAGGARNDSQVWGEDVAHAIPTVHDRGVRGTARERHVITAASAQVQLHTVYGTDPREVPPILTAEDVHYAWDVPPGALVPPLPVGGAGFLWITPGQLDPISALSFIWSPILCFSETSFAIVPRTVVQTQPVGAYLPPLENPSMALGFASAVDTSTLDLRLSCNQPPIQWWFLLLGEQALVIDSQASAVRLSNAQWSYERLSFE